MSNPATKRFERAGEKRPPAGESYEDAEERITSFIEEMCSETAPERILVVSHAGAIRVFLKLWLGLDPAVAIKIDCPHDTIFILNANKGMVTRSTQGPDTHTLPMKSE